MLLFCQFFQDGADLIQAAGHVEAALPLAALEGQQDFALTAGEGAFSVTLLFDCPAPALSPSVWRIAAEAGFGEERWEEDGAGYLRLSFRRGEHAGEPDGERRESHG